MQKTIVYFNGRFLPKEEVRVSPDDRGFLFGDGVYEVLHAYKGRLFKAEEHWRRLNRNLHELQIDGVEVDLLGDIAGELLRQNGLEQGQASLYVQVTRGTAPRRHAFPEPGTPPTVYLSASPFRPSPEKWERGVQVILVPDIRWTRCDIKAVALLPHVLASQQARQRGAEEAIFVREGVVTEGAHTNLLAVFDGQLVTHPLNCHILPGITRAVVLELSRELGIPVRESPIRQAELQAAEEILIVGTTTEIAPVVQVENWTVGDGRPGPVTRALQRAFRERVTSSGR